jgi:hypothetical protein
LVNLVLLIVVIVLGYAVSGMRSIDRRHDAVIVMTVIALLFGVHMVMAIGGADMPVVVSMLNSYSGLGGGGHRLHAVERSADRGRRVGRIERRDPVLHHVPGDEPQLLQRHRRRLRRRRLGARRRAAAQRRPQAKWSPISAAETAELLKEASKRHHRAGLRHGGGPGSAYGVRDHQAAAREGQERALRHSPGGGPHAGPHERAAGRGQGAVRHRVRNG